jgi:predicted glycosyltransferase
MPQLQNASLPPKRILLFAFEGGTGIGHLRRIACIAAALEQRFACLIVTGHREVANWFVSPNCEYVHIPAWESLLSEKAAYWSRNPFLRLSVDEAVRLRKGMLRGVVGSYAPDLIMVDHLPLGMHNELDDIIRGTPCKKYLVTRGVLNLSGTLLDLVMGGIAREYLHLHYDRIVVAADRNVVDFAKEYALPAELAAKTVQVGYVVDHISAEDISAFRARCRVGDKTVWAVVSAGGGQLGENLIRYAVELSAQHPDVLFDIVVGPRSSLPDSIGREHRSRNNLRVHSESRDMPMLNASADIVICSGGYNTLLEALQGNARILCVPSWKDPRDEQTYHSRCLKKFVEIEIVPEIEYLGAAFAATLGRARSCRADDKRRALNLSGVKAVEQLVVTDLWSDDAGR